ncbi:hypothetical protein [Streptomyces sp. NPDC002057]|uniref:hypothetical protein n=1 Tax=Streptomyces sp. NPDC002057 TaxID=3154664 RepID=UPI00332B9086
MSAPYERPTLAPSLYAYAEGLRASAPDAPLPHGGLPLPDGAYPPHDPAGGPDGSGGSRGPGGLGVRESRLAVTALLLRLLADPDPERAAVELERMLAATPVQERDVFHAVTDLPPPGDPDALDRARTLGRCLTRHGTTVHAVAAGLGLLARHGEPEDVPHLRVLGLLAGLDRQVVTVLDPLDRKASALVWLVHRTRRTEPRGFVDALVAGDETTAAELLLSLPTSPRGLGPEHARRIAEAVGLPTLLRREPDRPDLLAQALRLLTRMGSGRNYEAEICRYDDAVTLYETVAARAHELPPLLGHQARLVTLALGLHSGAAHLLPWPPGRRRDVMALLLGAVREPGTATDRDDLRRADWIRRTARRLRATRPVEPSGAPRLRIEVAVADPGDPDVVETRFLVDGRPLVPEAFGRGPGESPEQLLASGALRARPEPREVRLAEAYCTEGCCGALYVTVRREGAHVVWDGWRRPSGPARGSPETPAYRFDADAYDAEIARAERDRSWIWPARRTAWLISAGLRERPGLLTRWGLRRGWISTDFREPDTTVVTFDGPPLTADGTPDTDRPVRQYLWRLADDGTPPEERAAAALRRLAEEDPRGYPEPPG